MEDDSQRPKVAALRWGNAADAHAILAADGRPDLVIGADIVYREEDMGPLLESIAKLDGREVILALQQRELVAQQFSRKLKGLGWPSALIEQRGRVLILQLWPPETVTSKIPPAHKLPVQGPSQQRRRRRQSAREWWTRNTRVATIAM
eukprot:gnl/TRDRNA2_/TRDRNA2_74805_c0_seq1.p1 gnl/TRDRNA2_/TRDRNA2_74805_c0~~gnl/TRDRNA2_/TRDRNA2_74805_c0_seq1.p1  ORF type:complete len:148 (+),score=22.88 gnl/TRDRNA2_/TRDRNA2_74805_c0_seq1:3-446(+)